MWILRQNFMDKLNKEILRLSIPTIVSNITIPLLGICDTAISGHLGSELFLSAIAVGSVMLNVVFWIFGFLRGGTSGITANALGKGSQSEISRVFYRSLLIAFSAGAFLIIFQKPIFLVLWHITGSGPDIRTEVFDYFSIRIWGSPALLAIFAISGWFVGMQNTLWPMVIAIATNVINIIFSFLLAFSWGVGFNGVAIGTLISNWSGLLIAFCCLVWFLKGRSIKTSVKNIFNGEWLKYFTVNGNLFLRSFFIICVTMGVTAAGARIGYLTLAINVIIMQFFQFFSFFMDGYAYSAEAMVGFRAGQGNLPSLQSCVRRLLFWTLGTGIFFSLIYFLGLDFFTALLTESFNVREGISELYIFVALIPLVSCWAFIYDGIYIGITDTFQMMISTLLSSIIFFCILSLNFWGMDFLSAIDGNMIIWTAFLSYLLIRGIYLALLWPSSLYKNLNINLVK